MFPKRRADTLYTLLNLDPWEDRKDFKDEAVRAAVRENPEAAKKKYDFNVWGGVRNIHPLFMAVALGASRETIELIHEACPEAIRTKDRKMITPLHYAVHFKAPVEVVEFLTENYPEALEAKNELSYTPLELAALYQSPPNVVECLSKNRQKQLRAERRSRSRSMYIPAAAPPPDALPLTSLSRGSSAPVTPISHPIGEFRSDIVALLQQEETKMGKNNSTTLKTSEESTVSPPLVMPTGAPGPPSLTRGATYPIGNAFNTDRTEKDEDLTSSTGDLLGEDADIVTILTKAEERIRQQKSLRSSADTGKDLAPITLKRSATDPYQASREEKKYPSILKHGGNNGSALKKQVKFNLTPSVHDVDRDSSHNSYSM